MKNDNVPFSFELFILGDGERKIEEKVYAGMSNTSDFILMKEDHTLGNLLAEHLKQAPHVLMCGYKVAHPNVPEVMIRIQTDGVVTPKDAMVAVCKQLISGLAQLGREFTREYELRRIVAAGNQDQMNGV